MTLIKHIVQSIHYMLERGGFLNQIIVVKNVYKTDDSNEREQKVKTIIIESIKRKNEKL